MLTKGSIVFAVLMALNPLALVCYQNSSWVPDDSALSIARKPIGSQQRSIASSGTVFRAQFTNKAMAGSIPSSLGSLRSPQSHDCRAESKKACKYSE